MYQIAAFYKFKDIDPKPFRRALIERGTQLGISGVVLVAPEGLNGTIAGQDGAVHQFLDWVRTLDGFEDLDAKFATNAENPFRRLSVRLKTEIVSMGVDGANPNINVGTYVPPKHWDALISDPDVLVIDCRNSYEYDVGTFEGAIDPKTESFREFPEYARNLDPSKNPKVAMFCTGGIRCEKATGLMLDLGFEEVYHLQGGILKYLEERGGGDHLWKGDCFVFDRRVAVDASLHPAGWEMCWACRMPLSDEDKAAPEFEEGVTCPRCFDRWTEEEKATKRQRHTFMSQQSA